MTNNPTIDGVSRELVETLHHMGVTHSFLTPAITKQLRALLDAAPHEHEWDINAEGTATVCYCGARSSDAPAVERQELASPLSDIGQAQLLAICRGAAQRCEEQHAYMASASSDPHNWFPHKWVLDTMSSLLQINANNQQSTIAQLQARIEYLELELSGVENAKAQLAEKLGCADEPRWKWMLIAADTLKARICELETGRGETVVVVLPERQERSTIPYDSANDYADGWNACLDATAALNTPKTAEWHDVAGDDDGLLS